MSVSGNIASSNCPTERTRAVDVRDNRTYWVQKLADGRCWMLTNLAYAGGGNNSYGDVKALTVGTTNSYTQPHYFIPTGANPTNEPANPSTSTTGTGQYGYLSNWCAAMGMQTFTSACMNATSPEPSGALSICPSGWRLPTGVAGGEFTALNNAINAGRTNTDQGLREAWLVQRSGSWNSGGFSNLGSAGDYWSSSQYDTTDSYRLNTSQYGTNPAIARGKSRGMAIRCIAN